MKTKAICFNFNKSGENGEFPNCLKLPNITPVFKKRTREPEKPVNFLPVFQRYLKGYLVDNFQSSLIICYLNFNVLLERVMDLNIAYY